MSLVATLSAVAGPLLLSGLDGYRTAAAARYVAGRFQSARMEAVARSADVAVQFVDPGGGYVFQLCVDGNRNGVLTREIRSGIDKPLAPPERLGDQFQGVRFGVLPDLPPVDSGSAPPGDDPIKLGVSNLASFSATGTSSSGSVYIRGETRAQYVVRIFGDTGKTRILRFNSITGKWDSP